MPAWTWASSTPANWRCTTRFPRELRELVEDVLLNRRPDATERLIAFAETVKKQTGGAEAAPPPGGTAPSKQRLAHALVKGIVDYIEQDVEEARQKYPTSLVDHRRSADGRHAGRGRFVRGGQDVFAASGQERAGDETSGRLSAALLEAEKAPSGSPKVRGKILMATVKGDVHDIGKNIVGVVLGCNNYQVIDLGVMVPCEKILETAKREGVDLIGLSGLITPSLDEMVHVAREMRARGLQPAALDRRRHDQRQAHRGQDRPGLHQPTVHVLDASRSVGVVDGC